MSLEFTVLLAARFRHGIPAVRAGQERRGRIHLQSIDLGREFVLIFEHGLQGDDLPRVSGLSSHSCDKTRHGAALHLAVRLVCAYGLEQIIPFDAIGIGLLLTALPGDVLLSCIVFLGSSSPTARLASENTVLATEGARMGRPVIDDGNDGRTFRAMCVAGKLLFATGHATTFQPEFGSVGKSILDGVDIEILIDVGASTVVAEMSAAGSPS